MEAIHSSETHSNDESINVLLSELHTNIRSHIYEEDKIKDFSTYKLTSRIENMQHAILPLVYSYCTDNSEQYRFQVSVTL
jgi:hypothetical protein